MMFFALTAQDNEQLKSSVSNVAQVSNFNFTHLKLFHLSRQIDKLIHFQVLVTESYPDREEPQGDGSAANRFCFVLGFLCAMVTLWA